MDKEEREEGEKSVSREGEKGVRHVYVSFLVVLQDRSGRKG